MLTQLLVVLAQTAYAPSTASRYTGYLRQFATWCAEREIRELPTSAEVLGQYFQSVARLDRRHLTALDIVFKASGHHRPSQRADLEDVLIAVGLRGRQRSSLHAPIVRPVSEPTLQQYSRRISRFKNWCAEQGVAPGAATLQGWIASLNVATRTADQYKVAVNAWARMPAAEPSLARAQNLVQQPSQSELPTESKVAARQPKRRPGQVVLRSADKRLLFQLGRTGVAEHHRHTMGFARLRSGRIKTLIRTGYIEEHSGLIISRKDGNQPKTVRYYTLGRRGRRWLDLQGIEHVYRWNPQQLRHDLHLTDVYCQLPTATQRTWITETEIIEQLQAQGRYRTGEAVDAAIVVNGQPFAIEIAIGYKPAALAKKQACIRTVFAGRGLLIT